MWGETISERESGREGGGECLCEFYTWGPHYIYAIFSNTCIHIKMPYMTSVLSPSYTAITLKSSLCVELFSNSD